MSTTLMTEVTTETMTEVTTEVTTEVMTEVVSRADFYLLAPYLTLSAALVVLLLLIAFARSHFVAMITTVGGLLATLVALLVTAGEADRTVMHLLQIDGYTTLFNFLFVVSALVTSLLAYRYLAGRKGELEEFYILTTIATLGAMTMAAAVHFATFILGLEILSVSLYAMIAYPEEKHPPLEAALKYLVLSAVASTTVLFGMALIYNATGSMYFAEISTVAEGGLPRHLLIGQTLLFTGIAFKLSLVPFHMWTPDVYQGAPAPVTGFIATVSKAAVFALLLRLAIDGEPLSQPLIGGVVAGFAILSMIVGNLLALGQDNLKRILAYSSIAHMGYLLIALLGVVMLDNVPFAVETTVIYLVGYTLTTLAAFAVVTTLSSAQAGDDAQTTPHYHGLFWRRPVHATCLTAALLSLMGLPLTLGFVGKLYLLATGVQGLMWLLLWSLILGSAISVYYYVKIIYAMTQAEHSETYPHPKKTFVDLPIMVALGVAVVGVGIYPAPLIHGVKVLLGNFGL